MRQPFSPQEPPPHLQAWEVLLLVKHSKPPWDLFFTLLWQTGLRVSEGLAVTKADIHEDYLVVHTLKRKKPTKDRVPLNAALRQALLAKRGKHLFPYTRQAAWQALKAAATAGGIDPKRVHPHILRHSFAVYAGDQLQKEIGDEAQVLPFLQQLLRHANISTTGIYLKRRWEDLSNAFGKIKFQ